MDENFLNDAMMQMEVEGVVSNKAMNNRFRTKLILESFMK